MAVILMPKAEADAPLTGGGNTNPIHPTGVWNGKLLRVTGPEALPYVPKGSGYTTPSEIQVVRLMFGDSKSLEDEAPTNMKVFVDLTVQDGTVSIDGDADIPGTSWQMANSKKIIKRLAEVFESVEEVEIDGKMYVATKDGFYDRLIAGEYTNAAIGYEVYHGKEYTVKRGTPDEAKRRDALVKDFFTAV